MKIKNIHIHDEPKSKLIEIITNQGDFKKHIDYDKADLVKLIRPTLEKGIEKGNIKTLNDLGNAIHDLFDD